MPPRRTHTKSRNGCAKCKKRRVKCDEVHPACGNCIKHAIECDFSNGGGSSSSVNDSSASDIASTPSSTITVQNTINASNSSSLLSPPASTPDSYIGSPSPLVTAVRAFLPNTFIPPLQNQQHQQQQNNNQHLIPHTSPHPGFTFSWTTTDLELMYHYSRDAPSFLASTGSLIDMWTHDVPRLAFADKSGCAIHAMLAVSSLHLAFLEPHNRTFRLITATAHYDQAVRILGAMVPHICKDSCEALFIASALIVVFATASPLVPGNAVENEPWSIPEWVPLIRGVYSILREVWDWVESGCLGQMLKVQFYERTGVSSEETEALNALYRLCTDTTESDDDEIKDTDVSSTYFSAIHKLRKSFGSCTDQARYNTTSLIFQWPICVSDKYVSLLKERRPRALVIFAYYCVLLKRMERIERSIRDLEKWKKWLEWPAKMVRVRTQIEHLEEARSTKVAAGAAAAVDVLI
ncbi:uncharacterized protein H6S33_001479 [Morchella sextelata]|uniref:uncharacterized protein n=1 Tax=Morchella sextelata TaxID=1174677 RepID=UPI001D058B1D|nr:uncharacterized protein H6S33_001479 [Morchella sextelata]KAH0608345.1 hypothetical protein H6S33_001479 [Morchella sextelata]